MGKGSTGENGETCEMISLLFNRFSKAVTAAEIVGLISLFTGAARLLYIGTGIIGYALIAIVALLYVFIRCCTSIRWYRGVPRYSGIELQFKKAMVPTAYAMALMGTWLVVAPSTIPLVILALALAVVAHVNVILIRFHLRDLDKTPVNFYSSGRFLANDAK